MMLSLVARAEEKNVLAGQYAGCEVSLEATTQIPRSNFYVFNYGDDFSIRLIKETYEGTEKCDNQPTGHYEYKDFVVLDDPGNHAARFMTAHEARSKLYFKFTIARSYAAVTSSLDYPVRHELVDMAVLSKVQ